MIQLQVCETPWPCVLWPAGLTSETSQARAHLGASGQAKVLTLSPQGLKRHWRSLRPWVVGLGEEANPLPLPSCGPAWCPIVCFCLLKEKVVKRLTSSSCITAENGSRDAGVGRKGHCFSMSSPLITSSGLGSAQRVLGVGQESRMLPDWPFLKTHGWRRLGNGSRGREGNKVGG